MQFTKRIFLCFCLAMSTQSFADTELGIERTGWYVGGALGANKSESDDFSFSEKTLGHQAYGGYNFNQWFGIEASFFLSGDVSNNAVGKKDAYFSSLSIAPKFSFRISSDFNLFAKIGLTQLAYTEEYSRGYYDSYNDDDWYYGDRHHSWSDQVASYTLGAEWSITHHLTLRAMYDYLSGTLEEDDSDYYDYQLDKLDATLKTFSVGVHYQF